MGRSEKTLPVASNGRLGSSRAHPVIATTTWRLHHGRRSARQMALEAAERHQANGAPDLRKISGLAREARAQLDRELAERIAPLEQEAKSLSAELEINEQRISQIPRLLDETE